MATIIIDRISNTFLPLQTICEEDDSFSEYQTSVPTIEHEYFIRQAHITAPVDGCKSNPDNDVTDMHAVLDGTEADLGEGEEMSTADAGFDRDQNNDENFYVVHDDVARVQGKDKEIGMNLYGLDKDAAKYRNTDTNFNGVEKDLATRKELSAVVTAVENDRGMDEEMCTVFDHDERVICNSEDISAILAADQVTDENDELKAGNQAVQTAQPDHSFLEPPEEFRVRSIYLLLL